MNYTRKKYINPKTSIINIETSNNIIAATDPIANLSNIQDSIVNTGGEVGTTDAATAHAKPFNGDLWGEY
ncbi:hypothetical protein [Prevotella disiens]|uniref:hypothetical protein n=1 Tax=Prevotella disiens TaxID=28130 RepID=UPI00336A3DA2